MTPSDSRMVTSTATCPHCNAAFETTALCPGPHAAPAPAPSRRESERAGRMREIVSVVIRTNEAGQPPTVNGLFRWVKKKWFLDDRTAKHYVEDLLRAQRITELNGVVVPGPNAQEAPA